MGNTIKKTLRVEEKEITQVHLVILNSLLPVKLTNKEIILLSNFINLKSEIISIDGILGLTARKKVKKDMKISTAHLGNIIKSLKDKGYIYEEDNETKIREYLIIKYDGSKDFFTNYIFNVVVVPDGKK